MSTITATPDIRALHIPMDAWTKPFWQAASAKRLALPCCTDCHNFRWPPGPFCPHCQSQDVDWQPAGAAFLHSYTIIRSPATDSGEATIKVPGLVEFPQAGGVRLLAAIVDSPLHSITIGASLEPQWSLAENALVPVFRVLPPSHELPNRLSVSDPTP